MSDSSGAGFDPFDGDVYSPLGGRTRHRGTVRASDADRERAAEELRSHYASGRLDTDELSERLSQAYAARTHGSLDKLFADLPSAGPSTTNVPMAPVRNQGYCGRRSLFLPVLVPLFIIGGLASRHGYDDHFALVLLAFFVVCCWLCWAAARTLRSGSRSFYEAGRHWARHRSRW